MAFIDRQTKFPNRVLITPETGEPFYATVTRADEPTVAGTPINAAALNQLVNKYGDTLFASLDFKNLDSYHAFMKYRNVNDQVYGVNVGCGIAGGKGVVAFELREGDETTSPRVARFEIGELGVSYTGQDNKRVYLHNNSVVAASVE